MTDLKLSARAADGVLVVEEPHQWPRLRTHGLPVIAATLVIIIIITVYVGRSVREPVIQLDSPMINTNIHEAF